MSVHDHKSHAPRSVDCAVLTVSDTRAEDTDESGAIIKSILEKNGHGIVYYKVLKDELETIRLEVHDLVLRDSVQAIIINGGTGISKRDITFEAISSILDKRLDGFGELFRYLSYKEIGTPAIMSRAIAGVKNGRIIICIPGSPNAVKLAINELVIPELGHMVWEASRG